MSDGIFLERDLPSGMSICVYALTYGRARLGIGRTGSLDFDRTW